MVYRGHVKNGQIELDDTPDLPEGAAVELKVLDDRLQMPADRPIEEIIDEIAAGIPESEWAKLPTDLNDQLDHYVYGTPKE